MFECDSMSELVSSLGFVNTNTVRFLLDKHPSEYPKLMEALELIKDRNDFIKITLISNRESNYIIRPFFEITQIVRYARFSYFITVDLKGYVGINIVKDDPEDIAKKLLKILIRD